MEAMAACAPTRSVLNRTVVGVRCLSGESLGQSLHTRPSAIIIPRAKSRSNDLPTGASRRLTVECNNVRKTKRAPMDPDYPWPDKYHAEEKGFLAFFSTSKENPGKKGKPMMLPFERPLEDLEKRIKEKASGSTTLSQLSAVPSGSDAALQVRDLANKTGMDFTEQIHELQEKYDQLKRDIYLRLTPVQRLGVARHPNRPTFLDHILNITDKWVELHGDRGGYDDPALVCGLGRIDGMSFMFMGHQKGRNTNENIYRNFGMPSPNGYRKALRLMRHAEHHGFPIVMFIDTPGAYAGIQAEELGQGEAIAHNLREMFGLTVPTISVVIGEGGSGGALAIGCCNKMLMLENAVYYVASPEACAAILWKTAAAAPKATDALRITAHELQKLNVVDEVIPEPLGGAHADPVKTSLAIRSAILVNMKELLKLNKEEVIQQRVGKFRTIGGFTEGVAVDPAKKRAFKKRDKAAPLRSSPTSPFSPPRSSSQVNSKPVPSKAESNN